MFRVLVAGDDKIWGSLDSLFNRRSLMISDVLTDAPAGIRLDPIFVSLRDNTNAWTVSARAQFRADWPRVASFLDKDFATKMQRQLLAHYWELYIAVASLEGGLSLVPCAARQGRDAGPDLLTVDGMAIEAVLAMAGSGADAVSEGEDGVARSVPDVEICLRLSNAVNSKVAVHTRYLRDEVLQSDQPYVIAVGGSAIPSARSEMIVPRMVRVLFGIGFPMAQIDPVTMQTGPLVHGAQERIHKRLGAPVATDLFCRADATPGVAAVLYAASDPWNRPVRAGEDIVAIHNPCPTAPIALGALPTAFKYHRRDGTVERVVGWLSKQHGAGRIYAEQLTA